MGRSTFCLVALLAVLTTSALAEETYSDAFDHIDVEHILVNDELRNQYYMCFMETGPCVTEDQKYFKGTTRYRFLSIIVYLRQTGRELLYPLSSIANETNNQHLPIALTLSWEIIKKLSRDYYFILSNCICHM